MWKWLGFSCSQTLQSWCVCLCTEHYISCIVVCHADEKGHSRSDHFKKLTHTIGALWKMESSHLNWINLHFFIGCRKTPYWLQMIAIETPSVINQSWIPFQLVMVNNLESDSLNWFSFRNVRVQASIWHRVPFSVKTIATSFKCNCL